MKTWLSMMDPMAMASYGMYSAVKKDKGSFEDFLLHYNSFEANEGKNDWFTKMIGEDSLANLTNSVEILKALNIQNIDLSKMLNNNSFLDSKIEAYKLKAKQEMQKRGYDENKLKALEAINNFKNPLLA